jgi:hypothetical protein
VGAALWVQGQIENEATKAQRIKVICGEMIERRVPSQEMLRRLETIERNQTPSVELLRRLSSIETKMDRHIELHD